MLGREYSTAMSVTPTRCFKVHAGLGAGKSTFGVCASNVDATIRPQVKKEKIRSGFKFIKMAG